MKKILLLFTIVMSITIMNAYAIDWVAPDGSIPFSTTSNNTTTTINYYNNTYYNVTINNITSSDYIFSNNNSLMNVYNISSNNFSIDINITGLTNYFDTLYSSISTLTSIILNITGLQNSNITTNQRIDSINTSITETRYLVNTSHVTGGSNTTSNISLLWYDDDMSYNYSEGNGANPLDVYLNFTNVTAFTQIVLNEYYTGTHNIELQLYDTVSSSWESYYTITSQSGFTTLTVSIFDSYNHINNVNVTQLRLHHVENGISTHKLYIGFTWLINGGTVASTPNLQGYARYEFNANNFNGSGDFNTTGNINANTYSLNSTIRYCLNNPVPCYVWYVNSTYWNCRNSTMLNATLAKRNATSDLTCE